MPVKRPVVEGLQSECGCGNGRDRPRMPCRRGRQIRGGRPTARPEVRGIEGVLPCRSRAVRPFRREGPAPGRGGLERGRGDRDAHLGGVEAVSRDDPARRPQGHRHREVHDGVSLRAVLRGQALNRPRRPATSVTLRRTCGLPKYQRSIARLDDVETRSPSPALYRSGEDGSTHDDSFSIARRCSVDLLRSARPLRFLARDRTSRLPVTS